MRWPPVICQDEADPFRRDCGREGESSQTDLGVKIPLFRNLADSDESVRGHLSSRHTRNYRKRSISLDVGEKAIVRLLILMMGGIEKMDIRADQSRYQTCASGLEMKTVSDRSRKRQVTQAYLAYLTSIGVFAHAGSLHDLAKGLKFLDSEREQLLQWAKRNWNSESGGLLDDLKEILTSHFEVRTEIVVDG